MEIQYKIVDVPSNDADFDEKLLPVVTCDREVYGTDPSWQEGKTCVACTKAADGPVKWLFAEAPERCPQCGGGLADFWPIEGLLADYRADAVRPDYVFVAAYEGERVVGSFRGWSMTAEELDHHLNDGLPERLRAAPPLLAALRERFPGVDRFAYESSIFVLPGLQGRGIGKHMTRMGQQVLWDRGLRVFAMRTKTFPHAVTFPWYSKGLDYESLAAYPDADRRVVLARAHLARP